MNLDLISHVGNSSFGSDAGAFAYFEDSIKIYFIKCITI